MRKTLTVALILAAFLFVGCSKWVPVAHKGQVLTVYGFKGKTLSQGKHTAWGRDKMILMETREGNYKEKMNILCKDDLNFGFHVNARVTVGPSTDFQDVVNRMGFKSSNDTLLRLEDMYRTFAQPIVRSVSRGIVSKYETTSIRDAREEIEAALVKEINKRLKDTPLVLKMINTSNFDYPDVVTKAVELKRQTQIEIETEKATQAKRLLKKRNEFKLTEENYKIETLEAKTIGDSILIIADALKNHPEYLEWHRVQNVKEAALGPNNTFIFEGKQFSTAAKTGIMTYKAIKDLGKKKITTKKVGK